MSAATEQATTTERKPRGRGRWEIWVVYTCRDERVGESCLTKHRFLWRAKEGAKITNRNPSVLAHSMRNAADTGRVIFADCEVRDGQTGAVVWSDDK